MGESGSRTNETGSSPSRSIETNVLLVHWNGHTGHMGCHGARYLTGWY